MLDYTHRAGRVPGFATIIDRIVEELDRQEEKWGEQNHGALRWLGILVEEVGEVSETVNEMVARAKSDPEVDIWFEKHRDELIQTAAVCIATLESYDRQELRKIIFKG